MYITTIQPELKYTHAHTNITHVIYYILAGFKTWRKNPLNKTWWRQNTLKR
jgi:hypothetical protein